MLQKYLDNLLEVGTVKEEDGYVLGYYNNRVPVYGLYLKPKKDSILERVEIMAKGKFKLEADSENYAQEARVVFFEKLGEYLKEHGEPITEKDVDNMNAWLYKTCYNHMANIAILMKSGASVCDRETGEFSIVHLLSLDADDDLSNMLQGEVEDTLHNSSKDSFSHFRIWFNENKHKILTKKQLAYLEDENSVDIKNRAKINKTISERINTKYSDTTITEERVKKIKKRKAVLRDILINAQPRHLMCSLVKHMKDEPWLIEEVYGLSFDTCKMITNACSNIRVYECTESGVEEIRKCLESINGYFSTILTGLEKKL